jgi:hypothetical protein
MNFFFRKKPLVLNCVTDRPEVATYAPIKKASAFYPDWWKRLPKELPGVSEASSLGTMKGCVGMRDLYQYGLMLPMWSDLLIEVGAVGNHAYKFQYSDLTSRAGHHGGEQRGTFAPEDDYQHIKLVSPWLFSCDEDVPFVWTEPTWDMESLMPHRILPAVTDFKYQKTTNVNFLVPRKPSEITSFTIPFGHPLVQITPLTDRELKINVVEDVAVFKRLQALSSLITFKNLHAKRKEILEGTCPFQPPKEKNT